MQLLSIDSYSRPGWIWKGAKVFNRYYHQTVRGKGDRSFATSRVHGRAFLAAMFAVWICYPIIIVNKPDCNLL